MSEQPMAEGPSPKPALECDIVMKGGITSGVVYPLAVAEIGKTFRFRNVGGASAGAIAAGAAAAAELGRQRAQTGRGPGFDRLEGLPLELGEMLETPSGRQSRLLSLFQPQPATRGVHAVMLAALAPGNKLLNTLWACVRTNPLWALLGFGVGVALIEIPTDPSDPVLGALLAIFAGLLGAAVASAATVAVQIGQALPGNGYGICKGRELAPDSPPALSTYFADLFDQMAGQTSGKPLTFGDLEARRVHLNVVTTCVSQGRSDRLPMSESPRAPKAREPGQELMGRPTSRWNRFFFDPQELRGYLPERIVRHMVEHAPPSEVLDSLGITHLRRLPAQKDLPIVVAVRMSLSFPLLLSAVPLYSIDYTRTDPKDRVPVRCWFSDGGLTSNFPVHFFDDPIPSRPTFALNLRPFHTDRRRSSEEGQNVSSPMNSRQGREATWRYFERKPGFAALLGFLGALFDSTQNWSDNALLELPGYRERVAHVYLEGSEGGLNLVMGEKTIRRLSERGREAAKLLVQKFSPRGHPPIELQRVDLEQPPEEPGEPEKPARGAITWESHRFTRMHATLAALEEFMEGLNQSYGGREEDLQALIDSAPLTKAQREFFKAELPLLVEMSRRWQGEEYSFWENAPKPEAEIRCGPAGEGAARVSTKAKWLGSYISTSSLTDR